MTTENTKDNSITTATDHDVVGLAKRGWHVVPVKPRAKNPLLNDWGTKASADLAQIQSWLDQYDDCNWGLLLGPKSGLIDVEDDSAEGRGILEAAMKACGIKTPCYESDKSIHRLFRFDERMKPLKASVMRLFGTEWRFGHEASQSIIPPSIHPTGAPYQWLPGLSPDDVEVARLPDEMWELLHELREQDDKQQAEERESKRQKRRQTKPVVPGGVAIDGSHTKHIDAAEAAVRPIPWEQLLTAEGWAQFHDEEWTRPGNDWSNQKSATLTSRDNPEGMLHVWTNAAPIPEGHYGKWRFWYLSNGYQDSDQIEAAKAFLGEDKSKEIDDAFHSTDQDSDIINGVDLSNLTFKSKDDERGNAEPPSWKLKSAWEAVKKPAEMRKVIIEGLARRGEVVNIVASTKVGKSWLALLLLFAVVTGRKWLGRKTTPGRVLLIDNELHDETIQNRLETVARHLSVSREEQPPFDYVDLRGELVGIHDIERELSRFKAGELTLVVLDAKYRFFGGGRQENSNDDQTEFHNSIDRLARQLDCVIALVHHSTKGSQSSKSATDVGSGGGSQSRAVDCHLVIRSHEKADDLAVLDAAVRTFAPVESQTIRWEFPLWAVADDVQPVLKQESTRGDSRQEAKDEIGINELERILGEGLTDGMTRYELHQHFGGGKDRLNRLLRIGEWTSRFVQDGTRTTRNKRQSTVYKMASPSRQKPDLSGLFERTEERTTD